MKKILYVLAFLLFLSPTAWASHAVEDMADGTWVSNPRYISFGANKHNGHELVWRVLHVYTSDGTDGNTIGNKTAFLLLDDVLRNVDGTVETKQFHSALNNDWNSSDIYGFLNGAFFNSFTSDEQVGIITSNYTYGGSYAGNSNTGSSKIFLLSVNEANNSAYFANNADRGAVLHSTWWLRSPGIDTHSAASVGTSGGVSDSGSAVISPLDVRPAFKINLSSDIFESVFVSYGFTVNVQDTSGNDIAGAKVSLSSTSPARSWESFSSSTGAAYFKALGAGSYTITVSKPGYETKTQTITVPEENNATITLTENANAMPDTVKFGKYDGNAIEWQVLDIVDNKALLFAGVLFQRRFHSSNVNVWDGSELQNHLNDETVGGFLHTDNFTADEYDAIEETTVTTGASSTIDRVFLLSLDEATHYLPDAGMRSATQAWILRTPFGGTTVFRVLADGSFASGGHSATSTNTWIRPAMWVDLTELEYDPVTGSLIYATVKSVSPTGPGAPISGNVVVTFNKQMDTASAGTVELNTMGPLTGGSWTNNTTYTIPYSGLAYGTTYTVNISGFKDVAGNTMVADGSKSFTTTSDPGNGQTGNGGGGCNNFGVGSLGVLMMLAAYIGLRRK